MIWSKGDFIECVESANGLVPGELYCIEDIWPDAAYNGCSAHGDNCTEFGVTLTTVTLTDSDECFCSSRFKLVYRANRDLFKRLAMPVRRNEFTIQTRGQKGDAV